MRTAALIGCGDVATVHLEALREIDDIEVLGVYDHDPAAAARAAEHFGLTTYDSADALFADHPDVVHITTPHDEHVDLAIAALSAGINVLQEKPIAHTIEVGQRLVDAAAAHPELKIGICYQNRYNVSSIESRRLLDSGRLGDIRGAYASVVWSRTPGYYTDKPWRGQRAHSGGGLLMNQAIHTLDLVQWFCGDVVDIKGTVSTDKYGEVVDVEDTAHAYLTHDRGNHTSFYGTLTAPRHRPVEIELDCENAYVILRDGLEVRWADGSVERFEERTMPTQGRAYWGVSHELLIRDFYGRLDDPEPFWISPAEAMKSLVIAQGIYHSSHTER